MDNTAANLIEELNNNQPYSTELSVIRKILFVLLKDKNDQALIEEMKNIAAPLKGLQ